MSNDPSLEKHSWRASIIGAVGYCGSCMGGFYILQP